jgi:hypothetical protein
LKKNQLIVGLVGLALVTTLVIWAHDRIHFDFAAFRSQLALADWRKIAVATGCIYLAYVFRSVRWALLMRHNKKVPPFSLIGTQVIGFTAIALIGRVADPVRPYLVAKKTGQPLSSQLAVYIVERLFDAGSMALIFSSAILLTAWFSGPNAMPHAEIVKKSGYWGMILTIAGALFLFAVRLSGGLMAAFLERAFGVFSEKLGRAVGDKIRAFHTGLDTMRSFSDFAAVTALSVSMWVLIATSYLETTRAFVASPHLASMTPAQCVLLMVASGGASVFQLPVLGWFTQTGVVAAVISSFFGVPPEAATACAATLLLATFLSVVPVGLVWAQFDHISLRNVTHESEHAEEELKAESAPEMAE